MVSHSVTSALFGTMSPNPSFPLVDIFITGFTQIKMKLTSSNKNIHKLKLIVKFNNE